MKTIHFFAILVTLLAAISCDKSVVRTHSFELNLPFLLAPGVRHQCLDCDVSVSFTRIISDSRCPSDAECVWAGMVEVEVEVKTGNETRVLVLASASDNTALSVGGYLITLGEVTPYPSLQNPIEAGDYRITLTVIRL